jgi:hypothetical protein
MSNYITIKGADSIYHAGQIVKIGKDDMRIVLITGDRVYLKHIDFLEWIGLQAKILMKKVGL